MTEDASQSHVAKLVVRSLRNIVAMGKIGEVPAVQGHEHTNYGVRFGGENTRVSICLLYTSPSPRDGATSRMPSSA